MTILRKLKLSGKLKNILGDRDDLYFIGDDNGFGVPIATKEQFLSFIPSTAHCNSDGVVMRNGLVIGNRDDIEVMEEATP